MKLSTESFNRRSPQPFTSLFRAGELISHTTDSAQEIRSLGCFHFHLIPMLLEPVLPPPSPCTLRALMTRIGTTQDSKNSWDSGRMRNRE